MPRKRPARPKPSREEDWIEWIRACPDEAASPAPRVETAGDVKYHEGWVEDYDGVLKVLKDRPRLLGEIPPSW